MFWFTKNAKNENKDKRAVEGAGSDKSGKKDVGGQKNIVSGQRPGSAEIRAQALANAKIAREAIGEEALQKIAAALKKKQMSSLEQAKNRVAQQDAARVAEEIISMLDE